MKTSTTIDIIRWTARILGTLMIVFTLAMFIGEHLISDFKTFDTLMKITFAFWGVGLAGLVLAFWKEGLGGIISFFGYLMNYFLTAVNPITLKSQMNNLLYFLIPPVLYILCWWLARKSTKSISYKIKLGTTS